MVWVGDFVLQGTFGKTWKHFWLSQWMVLVGAGAADI